MHPLESPPSELAVSGKLDLIDPYLKISNTQPPCDSAVEIAWVLDQEVDLSRSGRIRDLTVFNNIENRLDRASRFHKVVRMEHEQGLTA